MRGRVWDARLIWVSSLPSVFGFLVFSVCVAIYFEHRGCEILCPNRGCPESAKIPKSAKPDAPAVAQIVYTNSLTAKPDARRQRQAIANAMPYADDSTHDRHKQRAHKHKQQAYKYALRLFDITLKMIRPDTF